MAKQYDAAECTLNELLSKYNTMYVPPFQRPYKWGEEQIEELFEDVFRPLDWSKGVKAIAESQDTHYMGAVVLCKDGERHMILDGQQRLTTLTIILAYLKAKMNQAAASDIKRLRKASGYDSKIVRQVPGVDDAREPVINPQDDDLRVYKEIIDAEDLEIDLEKDSPGASLAQRREARILRKRSIFKAFKLVRKFVADYIVKPALAAGVDEFAAVDLAASRLLGSLSVVVIEAHNESAAFRLFETLNARGLDLSAADLIKNTLFAIAKNEQQRKDVRASWENISETVNGDLVSFLRTFWLMEHDFVRKDGLFDAYKAELVQNRNSENYLRNFLEALVGASEHYADIVHPDEDSDVSEGVQVLNDLGAKTCRPLLLVLKIHRPHLLTGVISQIESLTVRWMVAGKVFNVLETTYARVAVEVSLAIKEEKSDEHLLRTIKSMLSALDVPDSETFKLNFAKYEVSRSSKAVRHMLCRINECLTTGGEQVANPKTVHIEHVFPQQPSSEAMEHSGIVEEEAEDYACKIGNVTLLAAKINMHIKNKAFPQKLTADKGFRQSRLAINDYIKSRQSWRKKEIDDRSAEFARMAVDIWKW